MIHETETALESFTWRHVWDSQRRALVLPLSFLALVPLLTALRPALVAYFSPSLFLVLGTAWLALGVRSRESSRLPLLWRLPLRLETLLDGRFRLVASVTLAAFALLAVVLGAALGAKVLGLLPAHFFLALTAAWLLLSVPPKALSSRDSVAPRMLGSLSYVFLAPMIAWLDLRWNLSLGSPWFEILFTVVTGLLTIAAASDARRRWARGLVDLRRHSEIVDGGWPWGFFVLVLIYVAESVPGFGFVVVVLCLSVYILYKWTADLPDHWLQRFYKAFRSPNDDLLGCLVFSTAFGILAVLVRWFIHELRDESSDSTEAVSVMAGLQLDSDTLMVLVAFLFVVAYFAVLIKLDGKISSRSDRWQRGDGLLGRMPVEPRVEAAKRTRWLVKVTLFGSSIPLVVAALACLVHVSLYGDSPWVLYFMLGVFCSLGIALCALFSQAVVTRRPGTSRLWGLGVFGVVSVAAFVLVVVFEIGFGPAVAAIVGAPLILAALCTLAFHRWTALRLRSELYRQALRSV